jgi:hypothetical protein
MNNNKLIFRSDLTSTNDSKRSLPSSSASQTDKIKHLPYKLCGNEIKIRENNQKIMKLIANAACRLVNT